MQNRNVLVISILRISIGALWRRYSWFGQTKRDGSDRQRGTGQIREKVKEDENGIGIADAKKFEFGGGRGGGGNNKQGGS